MSKAKIKREKFEFAIGSPTNAQRTYLTGEGVLCAGGTLVVHTMPIYRQADYPKYKIRKQGPYVVSIVKSGLRVSATNEKMVFAKEADAIAFAEAVAPFLNLFGLPLLTDDPRIALEKAKDLKEQVYEPLKTLATQHNAEFVKPKE